MFIKVTQPNFVDSSEDFPYLLNISKVDTIKPFDDATGVSVCAARDGTEWYVRESLDEIRALIRKEDVAKLQEFRDMIPRTSDAQV